MVGALDETSKVKQGMATAGVKRQYLGCAGKVANGITTVHLSYWPCRRVMRPARVVTMTLMSELPAGDTHDMIHHGGEVVAVVVPIAEYQQLRQAAEEQRVNEEFNAAQTEYLARREARTIRYVSHGEAGRRLGLSAR